MRNAGQAGTPAPGYPGRSVLLDWPEAGEACDSPAWLRLWERLAGSFRAEQDRWFLWLPVVLAAAAAGYFALPAEPSWPAACGIAAAGAAASLAARRARAAVLAAMAATLAAGFILAKARVAAIGAPVLGERSGVVSLEGWVESVAARPARLSIIVRPSRIEGFDAAKTPLRLRLVARSRGAALESGRYLRARARLWPPGEPVAPSAHDFGRDDWFQGIGGGGILLGSVETRAADAAPWDVRARAAVARWRAAIGERIRTLLPGDIGAFATALVNGERAQIGDDANEALRVSGLAHLLSISGLHMALFAGAVFAAVRALLAVSARLATTRPIKAWAAFLALWAALGYLLLSGGAVATQRSFVMIAIMFLAVMLGRQALSMRNLALAALAILIVAPESVLQASFQLSFLAVVALIAAYEAMADWRDRHPPLAAGARLPARIVRAAALSLGGMLCTSLIAGLATAPIAAYHFNRVSAYSLLANLLALPVVGSVVMPMAVAGLAAMPFGLDRWPFAAMGWGLELVMAIARWVSGLPGAQRIVPAQPGIATLAIAGGLLWLCLWRRPWRLIGLAVIGAGVAATPLGARPDLVVSGDAGTLAVRNAGGRLAVVMAQSRFAAERWLLGDGDESKVETASARPGLRCDELACVGEVKGLRVAFLKHPAAAAEDCARAEVVIASFPLRRQCRGPQLVIDRFDVWRNGAHALFIEGRTARSATVAETRGERPWAAAAAPARKSAVAGKPAAREDAGFDDPDLFDETD